LADKYDQLNDFKVENNHSEFNNKAVYEKLKKDFASFFSKEDFYNSESTSTDD
jgi:hypothetical protein